MIQFLYCKGLHYCRIRWNRKLPQGKEQAPPPCTTEVGIHHLLLDSTPDIDSLLQQEATSNEDIMYLLVAEGGL